MRWMPFRGLQHPHETGLGMKRGLRKVSRSGNEHLEYPFGKSPL